MTCRFKFPSSWISGFLIDWNWKNHYSPYTLFRTKFAVKSHELMTQYKYIDEIPTQFKTQWYVCSTKIKFTKSV